MRKQKKAGKRDPHRKASFRERVAGSISLPLETVFNLSQMQIVGNREVTIEGYEGIVEYDDNLLRIKVKGMCLSFWGSDLQLNYMNDENIVITGKIEQIEFLTQGKEQANRKVVYP